MREIHTTLVDDELGLSKIVARHGFVLAESVESDEVIRHLDVYAEVHNMKIVKHSWAYPTLTTTMENK